MPDFIAKILKEKLPPSTQSYDQEDRVSLLASLDGEIDPEVQHILPTLEKNWVGDADNLPKLLGA